MLLAAMKVEHSSLRSRHQICLDSSNILATVQRSFDTTAVRYLKDAARLIRSDCNLDSRVELFAVHKIASVPCNYSNSAL
jgi:hypothetical protein